VPNRFRKKAYGGEVVMKKSLMLVALLAACRSSGGSTIDAANHGDGSTGTDAPGGGMTIKQIRMTPPAGGAQVTVNNVVIVGWVTSSSSGKVWVQDQGGGAYSGIELFCNYKTAGKCPMTRAQIEMLTRGEVVNFSGAYDPFTPTTPPNAPTQIEVSAPMITGTGAASQTPVATTITLADVDKGQPTAGNQWDAVYVTIPSPGLTVSNVMPVDFQNSTFACTTSDGGMTANSPPYFGFEATGGGKTVDIGLSFYKSEDYCLVDTCFDPTCGTAPMTIAVNMSQSITALTGIFGADAGSAGAFTKISPVVNADLTLM
jgi:hypothetical protein